ncbi:hypothetical protein [Amycolatopsis sp. SID8362]|uniref:hypothetical protein n=1 Tax=Amycolatopsis sp. SID8362 TaxID=2690346 RepID=UPI001369EC42|nr:hypothetical protein [Amycolatopsis sp. SID8362]NBH12130.1 hypothetical protein [Amycolatopsis sp. SID8362]NED48822.1 hypothetical protein [Amycolatopsis sp. SID8362]
MCSCGTVPSTAPGVAGKYVLDQARARTKNHDLAFALDREIESLGESGHAGDAGLETSLGSLVEAATNVSGADLSYVDLRGIPLEGLRWSEATRWPFEWYEQIRRDSIELGPGRYEIRQGGLNTDRLIDTPV